jgi:hypothetical protein
VGGIETPSWNDRAMTEVGMEAWEQRTGSSRAGDARLCWSFHSGCGERSQDSWSGSSRNGGTKAKVIEIERASRNRGGCR